MIIGTQGDGGDKEIMNDNSPNDNLLVVLKYGESKPVQSQL
jgi:hypothetical protein